VNITVNAVNDAPSCTNAALTTNEDTPLAPAPPCRLGDGNDVTGATIAPPTHTDARHGSATTKPNTASAHEQAATPHNPQADQGTADANVATVNITVAAVNHAPVAVNDTYTTNEDTALAPAAPGVLGNDTDADGNTLTATKVTDPGHGSVTVNANGSFSYVPAA